MIEGTRIIVEFVLEELAAGQPGDTFMDSTIVFLGAQTDVRPIHTRQGRGLAGPDEPAVTQSPLPLCRVDEGDRDASADYVDWDRARRIVLPRLKPSQKKISLRFLP